MTWKWTYDKVRDLEDKAEELRRTIQSLGETGNTSRALARLEEAIFWAKQELHSIRQASE